MRPANIVAIALTLSAPSIARAEAPAAALSEARPFPATERAEHDIATAFTRATGNGHHVLLIFGGNWCHDSRALAGWFATPRFHAMLASRYEIVWINVGRKDRNLDIARRYGLDGISGTPTVLLLDAAARPINLDDAPSWRNAATRSEQAIYDYFASDDPR